jgi:uncharacterized protein
MGRSSTAYFTLITGASSGIGKALAIECAKRNMNLFLVALPDNGFDEFALQLEHDYGIKVLHMTIDLTMPQAPQMVYDHAISNHIKVNMLINNAGNGHVGNFDEMTISQVDEMVQLNLRALTVLSLLFIKEMKSLPKAHIANVGSLGAYTPIAYKSVYIATKSFVYYFTKSLQQEYSSTNIQFSVLMPGAVITNADVEERIKDAGFFGKISSLTPEYVAQYAMDRIDKGKFTIMPGVMNRAIFSVSSCLPSGILLYVTRKVFNKSN